MDQNYRKLQVLLPVNNIPSRVRQHRLPEDHQDLERTAGPANQQMSKGLCHEIDLIFILLFPDLCAHRFFIGRTGT
jgi:hypothetical protein